MWTSHDKNYSSEAYLTDVGVGNLLRGDKTYFRRSGCCIRSAKLRGDEPVTGEIADASLVPPPADNVIPAEGGEYSVRLTGNWTGSVSVRMSVGGNIGGLLHAACSNGAATVAFTVPANAIKNSRTVAFEYLWNGTWTKIGSDCTQQGCYYVSSADVTPAGDIPAEGKTFSLTLTGNLPSAGVEVRAQSGGTALVTGKVTASGTAVELAVPANVSYSSRTVTFEYLWNGTWTKIGADRTQAGYSISNATHNAPATIPGQGGSYNVTLTGLLPAAGVDVRASSGGTALVTGKVTKSGTAVSLTIPGQLSYNTRTVTFEYNWNGTWTKIGSDCTQQGWNVTAASVSPAGDIPAAGGTYTVTLTGWGGYKIRAISGSTELVVKNDYEEVPNYSASIVIPANTADARNVTFQYSQAGVWKDIETRTQSERIWADQLYWTECVEKCSARGGLYTFDEAATLEWKGWPGYDSGQNIYWTSTPKDERTCKCINIRTNKEFWMTYDSGTQTLGCRCKND